MRGHVQSIVAAIEDRDRTQGANLLPNVNPAFSWVRLAQRVPVRVVLDEVPDDFRMIAGRTATVSMREADTRRNDREAGGRRTGIDGFRHGRQRGRSIAMKRHGLSPRRSRRLHSHSARASPSVPITRCRSRRT